MYACNAKFPTTIAFFYFDGIVANIELSSNRHAYAANTDTHIYGCMYVYENASHMQVCMCCNLFTHTRM